MDFAAGFSPCFRTETHHGAAHARACLCGLFQGTRGRKNIGRMEELVPDLNYQACSSLSVIRHGRPRG